MMLFDSHIENHNNVTTLPITNIQCYFTIFITIINMLLQQTVCMSHDYDVFKIILQVVEFFQAVCGAH